MSFELINIFEWCHSKNQKLQKS